MPAITITDLENAKTDVDHIAAIANSASPTATDRLGNVKQTISGILAQIEAPVDAVQTVAAIAAEVTAVAGISAEVSSVAGISADVSAVAADAVDIGAVAGALVNVNTVADNIDVVNGAAVASRIYASSAAGLAAVASGEYFWVVSAASDESLELWWDNAGVATDTGKRMSSSEYLTDVVRAGLGGMGNAYELGSDVVYGSTTPNTSSYPATAQAFGTDGVTTGRGFLKDVSVRLSAAGTGYVEIYRPDDNSPSGWHCLAAVAVTASAAGVNTWQGSTIYAYPIPAGSRVMYRWTSGGVPRYVLAGAADRYISSTTLPTPGTNLSGSITVPATAYDWAVSYTITEMAVDSLDSRLDDVETGADSRGKQLGTWLGVDGFDTTVETFGNTGLAAAGTLSAGAFGWALPPTTKPGFLESVIIPTLNPSTKAAGSVESNQFGIAVRQPDGTYQCTNLYTVKLEVGVTNTLTDFKDNDGNPLFVPAGSIPFITQLVSGQVQYSASTDGTFGRSFSGATSEGATITFSDYANSPLFQYTLRTVDTTQEQRNESVDKVLRGSDDPVVLEETLFPGSSAPTGYTATGSWTFNDSATPGGAGAWTNTVVSKNSSALSKRNLYGWLTLVDTAVIAGLVTTDLLSVGGTAVVVDGPNNRIALYEYTSSGAATLRTFTALTFSLVAGRKYLIYAIKNRFSITYGIRDCLNNANSTSATFDGAPQYVMLHGRPGVVFASGDAGDVVFHKMRMDSPYKRKCHVLIAHADSIGEGALMGAASSSWPILLTNASSDPKRVVQASRANDQSTLFRTTYREENDFLKWQPTYVVLAFGANETDFWRLKMNTIRAIAKAEAMGATPILVTLTPRATIQASVINPYNAIVKARGFGDYDYIDFAAAVTTGNDGVTLEPTLFTDTVHPNAAGHALMYAQLQVDTPYLVS